MSAQNTSTDSLIGRVAREMTTLPEEDLPLVVEFVEYLKRQRGTPPKRRLTVAEVRSEARRRAGQLGALPRSEIVTRFQEIADAIRQEAVTGGTAVDGDWQSD